MILNNALQKLAPSAATWKAILKYLGIGSGRRRTSITNQSSLEYYLRSRASHASQTSLFGYLKTRAGTRFPELFKNPDYLVSINIAKWQVWLAALSDLAVFTGGLIHQRSEVSPEMIERLMNDTIEAILAESGIPEEAGPDFEKECEKTKIRIANCNWAAIKDDESAFTTSPAALIHWAPVIDEFKRTDSEIVMNSIRFRWIEIRRKLRQDLDVESLMQNMQRNN